MVCNGDISLMFRAAGPADQFLLQRWFCRKRHIIKNPKMFRFTTCSSMGTPFAHAELIWVLSLCKYSTNCPRPSETIYSYRKAWEPSVPNGVICIVNGNALLVCSIWLCTGALMGAWWTVSVLPSPHAALWRLSAGARLPLVAQSTTARLTTKPEQNPSNTGCGHSWEEKLVILLKYHTYFLLNRWNWVLWNVDLHSL